MPVCKVKNKDTIASLFDGWQETFIWSCLQDCMGDAYADDLENPQAAQIILGDICFIAGKADEALIQNKQSYNQHSFVIMVPQDERWAEKIEAVFGDKALRHTRYALKKEPDVFDRAKLQGFVSALPGGYELKLIDRALYEKSRLTPWSLDLCWNFPTYEGYQENGLGVVVLKDGEIVSGASSYFFYRGGIEIEIDTREDERRKGFATVCGAKLILECLERGLYPSWDAHNKESLALAEKLGYYFDKEYPAYEIHGL